MTLDSCIYSTGRIREVLLISITIFCLGGCGGVPRYSYDSIKSEYTGMACRQPAEYHETAAMNETRTPACRIDYPLTMRDALDIARKNNADLVQAAWRIEQSSAMLALADTGFWPQVSFYTEYMQGDAPSAYLFKKIDQRMLSPDVNFNDPGWFENFESGLKARMNLFNGGRDYLAIQMARRDVEVSRLNRRQIANDLTAQVIRGFHDALAARDFIIIAEESVATVSEQLRIMRVRYQGGAIVKADLLSMEVRLAQAREQLVSSRNRYQLARAALANLMGLDPSILMEKDQLLADSEADLPAIPEDYDTGVVQALNQRPELAQVREQLVKSRMALASAKTACFPRLDLMGKYYMDDPDVDYDTSRDNWTTALQLNWDLFTGFSRRPQIYRAEAMVRELLAADRQAALGIKLDVKTAYYNLEEARSRYTVAKSSVESAEESFRLVREHYQGGAVTITRYLEAELDRNRARIRATAAYYDQIKAKAEIARAIGMWAAHP